MKITLIAAMDDNLGIGKDGRLPWHNKEDLQHFKDYTEGKVCAMGRKTWDSLPVKPLPNRDNIILRRCNTNLKTMSLVIYDGYGREITEIDTLSIIESIDCNMSSDELVIIGGASIYEQFMPHATHMVLTHINGDYNCDTFFPEFDASEWFAYEWKDIENGKIHYMERT